MADKRVQDEAPGGIGMMVASAIQVVTGPWTRENGASWLRLICFVLTVWWLFLQPFRIPSNSMYPTLNGDPGFFIGDRVFVNKLAFGPRIPFTTTRLWSWGAPKRFDIVVFRAMVDDQPAVTLWQKTVNFFLPKVLIKRVIGLPGERVHIANGNIYINDSKEPLELPESMKKINVRYTNSVPWECSLPVDEVERQIRAQHPNEVLDFTVLRAESEQYRNNLQRQKFGCINEEKFTLIPPGHYFMLGDNSEHSYDSRYWGWVPQEYMFGRAFCIWWPFKHRADLSGFTHTVLGMLLLIGIPGILLSYEFLIRPFCVVSLTVRSAGLSGALQRGDHVMINRLAFGVRRPFSDKRMTKGRSPGRGEVVAYFVPHAEGIDYAGEALLGRVAGIPGDALAVEGGIIHINGGTTGVRFEPNSKNARKDGLIRLTKNGKVPNNQYLVLSGPEDDAPDSRSFGWVPHDLLIGPVARVWWPAWRLKKV